MKYAVVHEEIAQKERQKFRSDDRRVVSRRPYIFYQTGSRLRDRPLLYLPVF